MSCINLYLFGAPRLEFDGRRVEIDTRKAIALLAYLALNEGEHSRDSLAALLWPDYDQTHARAALRRTLSALNKALGLPILSVTRESIAVSPSDEFRCDVLEFKCLLDAGQGPASIPESRIPELEKAVSLYREDFMAGFSLRDSLAFDDWQFYQSEILRNVLANALEKLSRLYGDRGSYELAIAHSRRWSSLDPLREEAHRVLMQLFAWSGQRNAALRQYRDCVRILDQELGVPPLEETTLMYQAILENRLEKQAREDAADHHQVPLARSSPESPNAGISRYPMVGRKKEWDALLQAHSSARLHGRICFLEGEAGIGKTRLAEEFLLSARDRGARIFQARCYEGESDLAYAPFLTGIKEIVDQPGSSIWLESIPGQWLSEATRLVPDIAARVPGLPALASLEGPGAKARFYEGLRQVILVALDGDLPGVLFLDDLHWADAASLDLLTYLTRRLKDMPVLILVTSRDDVPETQPRLLPLYSDATRGGSGERLRLSRLSSGNISEIVDSISGAHANLPGRFADRLYQESEGLPLVAMYYLEAVTQDGGDPEGSLWGSSQGLFDVLRSRLIGIDEAAGQLLGAAAVIGRSFDLNTLRQASGRSESETISGLESLLSRRLIREQAETEQPGTVVFDFTHEKLRQLVYQETSLARRRLLHRRIAEMLTPSMVLSQAAVIAHHYQHAGFEDQAAHYFKQAGEYARSLFANLEAIAHFQSALAAHHPEQAWLHEAIGDLQTYNGDYRQAISSYQKSASLLQSTGDRSNAANSQQRVQVELAQLEHKLGEVHHRLGEWELAEGYYRAAFDDLNSAGVSQGVPRLYADWSRTVHRRGEDERAQELAEQALHLAESSQDRPALAQVHNILGILARSSQNNDLAIQHLELSREIAAGLPTPAAHIAALNNLALTHADLGQFDRAVEIARTALTLCERLGDRHRQAALHNNLADLHHSLGQGDEAMHHLKQAVIIFSEIGSTGDRDAHEPRTNPEIWKLTEW